MFYEATPTNTWYNPLYNNGAAGTGNFIASIARNFNPNLLPPSFPQQSSERSGNMLAHSEHLRPHAEVPKNEYTWNANLQVQQQLAKNDSLTLGTL